MNEVPLHPMFVHLPIGLSMLMPFVIGGFAVAMSRGLIARKAFVVVLVLQSILVVSGFIALRTGEAEEERVEAVVPHEALEHHEHDAKRFVASAFGVLVLGVLVVIAKRESLARGLALVTAIGALGSAFMALDAGHHGGELVYEHGAADAYRAPRP